MSFFAQFGYGPGLAFGVASPGGFPGGGYNTFGNVFGGGYGPRLFNDQARVARDFATGNFRDLPRAEGQLMKDSLFGAGGFGGYGRAGFGGCNCCC